MQLVLPLQHRAKAKAAVDVFDAAKHGDANAQKHVDDEAQYLGLGITSLLHLYSPEVVIIGGGLSNAFDQLHPGISNYVSKQRHASFPRRTRRESGPRWKFRLDWCGRFGV